MISSDGIVKTGRKRSWPVPNYYTGILFERPRKTTKHLNSDRVPFEIRTRLLQNTSPEKYS
jgi:hypothetical protein